MHDFKLQNFATAYKLNALRVFNSLKILEMEGYLELTEEIDNPSKLMLEEAGLKKGDFKVVAPSFSLNELLSGKVDALNAYVSNEPYFLQKFDIDYVNIAPEDYGINFYADCLFSTKEYISKHSSVADKFLAASLQGWEYAVNHQEEMAELILEKYNPTKIKDHLLFEAQTLDKFIMW